MIRAWWMRAIACLTAALCGATAARAGGGPENLFLVVNSRSWASRTVANYFAEYRQIPPSNVLLLDWSGDEWQITVEVFRKQFLTPILAAIKDRGLESQIDYVVYAPDFPTTVDFRGDNPPDKNLAFGSLNSLTFLHELVAARSSADYSRLDANYYVRKILAGPGAQPTLAFRHDAAFNAQGNSAADGRRYLLSTLLAVTSGRGTSVREAVEMLRASSQADGTRPKGVVYFMQNDDIRSRTRAAAFPPTVAALEQVGVRGEILPGKLPRNKTDVAGLMAGSADFDWRTSGSKLMPGAICEHLTSFGGRLHEYHAQTTLTEFLRYGAAGASGTVIEPFAIQAKFPHPWMHVHYARGATLAEAFYLSVPGPYQLLIVGDPLCRPWAAIPAVAVEGVKAGDRVQGTITLRPTAKIAPPLEVTRFELFVDGVRRATAAAGEPLTWDSTQVADGRHELRVVAIEGSTVASQGRWVMPVNVANHSPVKFDFAVASGAAPRWGKPLTIAAAAPGAKQIAIWQHRHEIGRINGDRGTVEIAPQSLGTGPVVLRGVASFGDSPREQVEASPLSLVISPGSLLPAAKLDEKALVRGLVLTNPADVKIPVQDTQDPLWLEKAGIEIGQTFSLAGVYEAPANDLHQLVIRHWGPLTIRVDQTVVYQAAKGNDGLRQYIPLALAAGWHRMEISGIATVERRLYAAFGGPGTKPLDGARFKHE